MLNIILEDKSKSLTNISAFFVRSQLYITVYVTMISGKEQTNRKFLFKLMVKISKSKVFVFHLSIYHDEASSCTSC